MNIKTLHITNCYHAASGGIRTFYQRMLAAADGLGRSMRLVVPSDQDAVEDFGSFGRIYRVKSPPAPAFDRRYRLLLPHRYLWPGRTRLKQILCEERPDLVEICDKYALVYLGGYLKRGWIPGAGRPVTVGLSCERMDDNVSAYVCGDGPARRFAGWYMNRIYMPMFHYHVAVSEYAAGELRATAYGRRHPDCITVMSMGVDENRIAAASPAAMRRGALCRALGLPPYSVLLLYAGRLAREKNLDLLVAMMEELQRSPTMEFRLLVAGSGPLEQWLRDECRRRLGDAAVFVGHVESRERLVELLHQCDVFVHPNPREPFGIAPLEAMAAGLPLVAPDTGGVTDYARDANAWLVPSTGPDFAQAVRGVVLSPLERADRVRRGRETAAELDWTRVAARYFEHYDRLFLRRHRLRFTGSVLRTAPDCVVRG
jgi:glycosyltransferase involved in cell wall biosynthesis